MPIYYPTLKLASRNIIRQEQVLYSYTETHIYMYTYIYNEYTHISNI